MGSDHPQTPRRRWAQKDDLRQVGCAACLPLSFGWAQMRYKQKAIKAGILLPKIVEPVKPNGQLDYCWRITVCEGCGERIKSRWQYGRPLVRLRLCRWCYDWRFRQK